MEIIRNKAETAVSPCMHNGKSYRIPTHSIPVLTRAMPVSRIPSRQGALVIWLCGLVYLFASLTVFLFWYNRRKKSKFQAY